MEGLKLREYATVVWRYRVLVGVVTLLGFVGGALTGLLRSREYVADAMVVPAGRQEPSAGGISRLASEFGLQFDLGGGAQSPELLAEVLRSSTVLFDVAAQEFTVRKETKPLFRFLDVDTTGLLGGRHEIVEAMQKRITSNIDPRSGVLRTTARFPMADLPEPALRRALDATQTVLVSHRRQERRHEVEFIMQRLTDARDVLTQREDSLTTFLQANREFQRSPQLQVEYDRLSRHVNMQQSVVTSLAQNLAQAEIDAERVPLLMSIIDAPEGSLRPMPRGTVARALVGALLAMALALLLVAAQEGRRLGRW